MCPGCAPDDQGRSADPIPARSAGREAAPWRSVILAGEGGDAVNIAQQDRIAQREHTCPRCGAQPGKSCWEKARGNPGRKTYLARPHAERAGLVPEEDGLAQVFRRCGLRLSESNSNDASSPLSRRRCTSQKIHRSVTACRWATSRRCQPSTVTGPHRRSAQRTSASTCRGLMNERRAIDPSWPASACSRWTGSAAGSSRS
jgi:hypothetical protein